MARKKRRLPDYITIIGAGTEVAGGIRFSGGMHIDGKVVGDICGQSEDDCALTLGQSGTIQGNLNVAHVLLDGTVIGDVRASKKAELASGARIDGDLHYGDLVMAVGAKVNGKLLALDEIEALQPGADGAAEKPAGVEALPEGAAVLSPRDEEARDRMPSSEGRNT